MFECKDKFQNDEKVNEYYKRYNELFKQKGGSLNDEDAGNFKDCEDGEGTSLNYADVGDFSGEKDEHAGKVDGT